MSSSEGLQGSSMKGSLDSAREMHAHEVEKILDSLCSKAKVEGRRFRLFRHRSTEKMAWHIICDLITFTLCLVLAYGISAGIRTAHAPDLPAMSVAASLASLPVLFGLPMVMILIACREKGHYTRFKGFWEEFGEFLHIAVSMAGLTTAYLFFVQSDFSRLWLATTWALVLLMVPMARMLLKHILIRAGRWFTPTIVVGSGKNALESALAMESNPLMGFEVVALMEIGDLQRLAEEGTTKTIYDDLKSRDRTYPLIGYGKDVAGAVADISRCYIVLALESSDYEKYGALLGELAASRKNLSIIPPLRGLPLLGAEISPIFRHEVLHLRIRNNLSNRLPRFIKRSFDIVMSGLALIALSPLFLILMAMIRRDGGSPFYAQTRIGRNQKSFKCWKFRSMRSDAEAYLAELLAADPQLREEYEHTQKLKNDPRITPVGQFIRRTSIDELPQLWNVFIGEMSLVGPRPVKQDELDRYGPQARYYAETAPGITGLWQISGRNDVKYSTRVSLDSWYVRNWSLWYDITILTKTIAVVLKQRGAY